MTLLHVIETPLGSWNASLSRMFHGTINNTYSENVKMNRSLIKIRACVWEREYLKSRKSTCEEP